ncbi:Transcription initiation factor TFIID subunit 12 [Choanephora cucurbitarum]|uniref:TBP-associated factor 12 n=1 Tax=Choanephora cucurbitarum TaxID=101091 RepID=A0A1C7NL44_9FUNG|nr:Transcription initiation factor TFIID subunit 12 [Choanephora cucurbitarum]
MGLVAQQLNNASPQNAFAIQQPQQVKPNPGTVPTSAAQAAAVAAAAAAAAKNNGGIFTFPTQPPQQPQQPQPQQLPQPQSNQMQTTTLTTAPSGTTMMMPATTTTTNNAPMNNNAINTGTATTSGIQPTPTAGAQIATPLKPAAVPSIDNDGVSRVLTKRKIQELVSQIDPSERLEPEVEDILLEIADEFIESVTTFACQLAKHRKSDTLEVKDVQLHLERNWNIRIPGFAADDIRPLRKPVIPSSHQVKVQAVNSAKNQASNTASKKEHHANNNNTNNN